MKIKISHIFLLLILFSCSTINDKNIFKQEDFTRYQNSSLVVQVADHEEVKEVYFEILLHNDLNKIIKSSSGHFRHLFFLNNNQFVSTLYIPWDETKNVTDNTNLSYLDFCKLLEDNDFSYYFNDVKLMKNRKFGIKKVNNKFYVIYLNVIPEQIEKFNYSINSIKL